MIKYLRFLRNKYIATIVVFAIYALFLDDSDVSVIYRQKRKLSALQSEKELVQQKLTQTRETLNQLNSVEALEKFAREEKMFKRSDEDIFILIKE